MYSDFYYFGILPQNPIPNGREKKRREKASNHWSRITKGGFAHRNVGTYFASADISMFEGWQKRALGRNWCAREKEKEGERNRKSIAQWLIQTRLSRFWGGGSTENISLFLCLWVLLVCTHWFDFVTAAASVWGQDNSVGSGQFLLVPFQSRAINVTREKLQTNLQ